ncbi:MAG: preprotein translocase subunit SecG [Acidobacteria bacterium]|nr:preprotein translocase subunit SecG [Acidobacteriota bacterium]
MEIAVTIIHALVSVLLILIVLIQGGENVDITAAFGGVSQAAFGPRGAVSTLAKITWALAGIFMATSITLSIMASRDSSGSVIRPKPAATIPATPAPSAPVTPAPAPAQK